MMPGAVIVTGSSSGIGRGIALRLARAGYPLVCVDRTPIARPGGFDEEPDVPTDELIRARGGTATFVEADVTAVEALASALAAADGPVWGAVLTAGIYVRPVSILEELPDEFDRTMAVNARAVWQGLGEVGRHLVAQGSGGRLVCMGSISGLVGMPSEPAYCASKAAVSGLVRASALDLAPHGVTVNAVCPGLVRTSMLRTELDDPESAAALAAAAPLGRVGTPADVAGAVAYLVSEEAGFVTGVSLPVDGGYIAR
jgi:NAD(P)-dependent dehydrogenase (short-subunit alcohol dehydrogenase family)